MNIKKIKLTEWPTTVNNLILSGTVGLNYAITDAPLVLVQDLEHVDCGLCEKLGYRVFKNYHIGGVIVTNIGDFGIGYIGHVDDPWPKKFTAEFIDWLKTHGLNATLDNNDILVDGYKVCGMSTVRYGSVEYTPIIIGVNTKVEDIKQICQKPMIKIPKGLSDFGITADHIEKWLLDFCNNSINKGEYK